MSKTVVPETTVWIVWIPGVAGPSVIESYSKGQAVEYFLATHGVLRYNEIKLCQVDGNVNLIASVVELIPFKDCKELDEHHKPIVVKELS